MPMKIALLLDVIIPSASAESIAAMRMADAMESMPVEAGESSVSAAVTVVFGIE